MAFVCYVSDFENQLEQRNPGAKAVVESYLDGVPLEQLHASLRDATPNIIAKAYEPSASRNVLDAQLADIIAAMETVHAKRSAPSDDS